MTQEPISPPTAEPAPTSAVLLTPAQRKQAVVARIRRQREVWQTRRIQAALQRLSAEIEAREAAQSEHVGGADGFPRSQTLKMLLGHPVVSAVAVALSLALGPSRLARIALRLVPYVLARAAR